MISTEVVCGRRFVLVLQPGDDVLPAIVEACGIHSITQGYLPVFLGAFTTVTLIGTAEAIHDEDAPLPLSVTHRNTEGTGAGTLVTVDGLLTPHVHVSVGLKGDSAQAFAGHLLGATVQYVTEIVIEEILEPHLTRRVDASARGLAVLSFDAR